MTDSAMELAEAYDREASATAWLGPELALGLAYRYVHPGQTILDIGIGTGLGSVLFHQAGLRVLGMDVAEEMLAACRCKGFAADLKKHDLRTVPYPYAAASVDHAVCVGVLQFFDDLNPVFSEASRILRDGGIFVFVVGDRRPDEQPEVVVGAEHTGTDATVTMYLHSAEQIALGLASNAFQLVQSLAFPVYMDRDRTAILPAKVYLARKAARV